MIVDTLGNVFFIKCLDKNVISSMNLEKEGQLNFFKDRVLFNAVIEKTKVTNVNNHAE